MAATSFGLHEVGVGASDGGDHAFESGGQLANLVGVAITFGGANRRAPTAFARSVTAASGRSTRRA